VLFGLVKPGGNAAAPTMMTGRPTGGDVRPRPTARRLSTQQVNVAADLLVDVQILHTDSRNYYNSGCMVAGCPGPITSTKIEQGLVMQRLSTGKRRIITRGGTDRAPVWSPDGREIAYLSHVRSIARGEQDVVALIEPSGLDLGPVSPPPMNQSDGPPTWAPNGRAVATLRTYVTKYGDSRTALMVLPVDGRPARRLADGHFAAVQWAPDGRHLVAVGYIMATVNGRVFGSGSDLFLVDANTGAVRRLTHFAEKPREDSLIGGFCGAGGGYVLGVYSPAWSADSRRVAFLSSYPHKRQLGRQYDVQTVDVLSGRVSTVFAVPRMPCPERPAYTTLLYGWVR
jgi:Tol biopolymer transport system component